MFLPVRDLTVHVRVEGSPSAPALLLLHSLGASAEVWDAQAAALAASFRVIRPDMRGHGLTTVTPGPYRIEELARDALAVLDALGVNQAHVAGLSIGGLLAQSVAAQAPARVASLILCDTALAIPPPESWRDRAATVRASGVAAIADAVMARWVTPAYAGEPGAQGLRAMLMRTAPEGYAASAEAIAAADLTASTSALRVPALVLVGERDESTPPSSAEALHRAIAGSSLEVIGGAAHIPTVEAADAVTDAMRRFLSPEPTDFLQAGLAVRRQVLGDAHVERSMSNTSDLDREFQEFITRTAWGGVWTRPHFDRRQRSIVVLTILAALGHHEELALHARATRNTGASEADLRELLFHVAAYAGIPAGVAAMRVVKKALSEA